MNVEAIVLTGGASRRMGTDKSKMDVDGFPLAKLVVDKILAAGIAVTVLGREPVEFAGPLAAIGSFVPSEELVFAGSCDLVLFNARLIETLRSTIGEADAAVPSVGGRLQPLCALYRASAFAIARDLLRDGAKSMMAWLDRLEFKTVTETQIQEAGIETRSVMGVNTIDEWNAALASRQVD